MNGPDPDMQEFYETIAKQLEQISDEHADAITKTIVTLEEELNNDNPG